METLGSMDAVQSTRFATRHLLICALLPLVVVAVFWPATHNGFVNYDDPAYVLRNPWVQAGPTLQSLRWALTATSGANWHPLTWISHMVDCRLFGLQPCGHHLTSVVLHAINTLLGYLVLRKLTGSTWRSLCVAVLFGLHPLRAESVAWVAERKDVLSTFFWMATLWAYAMWVDGLATQRAHAEKFYRLAWLCFVLGLMSKPMLVTLPFVLLLLDYWPLRRLPLADWKTLFRLIGEKLPFFGSAFVVCGITFAVQHGARAVKDLELFPLSLRAGNAILAYSQYLGKFFSPLRLAIFYPHPGPALSWSAVLFSGLLLLSVTGIAVWQRRQRPWIVVGWLWYLGTLVPAICLVQVGAQAMADRYTYIPMFGFSIALVWTAHEIGLRWRIPIPVLAAAATGCAVACLALTQIQLGYWHDSETLFRHAVAVTKNNAVAHGNLAAALAENGTTQEAIGEWETALQIDPDSSLAHLGLGLILDSTGQADEAVKHLQQAVHLEPEWPKAAWGLANALDRHGRTTEAISAYRRALQLEPNSIEARRKLGSLFMKLHRYPEALQEFQDWCTLQPDSADAWNNIGGVLLTQRRFDEARPYFEQALRLQPHHPEAQRNLEVLQRAREVDSATRPERL